MVARAVTAVARRANILVLLWRAAEANPECWTGGVTKEYCCDTSKGPEGNAGCWDQSFTFDFCCFDPSEPKPPPVTSEGEFPDCAVSGVVLRHEGDNGIFVDMSTYGSKGCFMNDCKKTDKFEAVDKGICARLCSELEECTHWSFGYQAGKSKCFLRKSDAGRQKAPNSWISGAKACAPAPLMHGNAALVASESAGLKECDVKEKCADTLKAATTWLYAIRHMKAAAENRVDPDTMYHIDNILRDTTNLANQIVAEYRPSDSDFGRVIYNNRLIFNTLVDWLRAHPQGTYSETDMSLPNPLRTGGLCGQSSCYET